MKPLCSAFAFLTVLRLPANWCGDEDDLGRSVWFFPVVGIFIGGLLVGIAALTAQLLPPWPLAVILVLTSAAITGGLHLDGLADTADGFFSSRPRGKILEIMHDSRIGAMGVLAIIFAVALKITSLAHLAGGEPLLLWQAALLMPVAGRCSLVFAMSLMPYAREEGLATLFWQRSPWRLLWALVIVVGLGWAAGDIRGLVAAFAALATTLLLCMYSHRKIGGGTGDTLGATNEIVETVAVLAFVAWPEGLGA